MTDASFITLEGGIDTYVEPGFTAIDNYDGDITSIVDVSGTVDVNTVGTYYISYNVSDACGNQATEVVRTIDVVDTTPPVITLNDASNITLEVFDPYVEYGVTAVDNIDGDITNNVDTSGNVDVNTVGTYHVTYNVTDTCGNVAIEKVRTIHVVDTTPPIITLIGDALIKTEANIPYVDPGATAIDNYDGDISNNIDILNNVNTDVNGTYTITYNVTDSNGNAATEVIRTVIVQDTTPPVITLIGVSNETIEVHTPYVDPGVYAVDNYDGDISNNVTVINNLNANILGTYTIKYTVSDSTGNKAIPVIRTIHVVDTTPPVITLTDASFITLEGGIDTYEEPGFTAIDNYDGDITSIVDVSGTVDVNTVGTYYISYNVSDACGNQEVVRTIEVITLNVRTIECC